MRLDGSVALVTGAAHRLGRAMALGLASQGAELVVHFHKSAAEAEETADMARGLGVAARVMRADLASPSEIARMMDEVREGYRRLDVLVNSAASFRRRRLADITAEEWDRVHDLNLRAAFLCSQAAAGLMGPAVERAGVPGLIVNMADLSGMTAWRHYAHHAVSKAGLLHLTSVAARELAPDVRVNAIVPGAVLPPPGLDPESDPWLRIGTANPLGRSGTPDDVVRALLFLAESDFVTGIAIPVDGGQHLLGPQGH